MPIRRLPAALTLGVLLVCGCQDLLAPPSAEVDALGFGKRLPGKGGPFRIAAIQVQVNQPSAPPAPLVKASAVPLKPTLKLSPRPKFGTLAVTRQDAGTTVTLKAVIEGSTAGLIFRWKASDGTLSPDTGPEVVWTPPEHPGSCDLMLIVTDANGCSVTGTQKINVAQNQLMVLPFKPDPQAQVSCPPVATANAQPSPSPSPSLSPSPFPSPSPSPLPSPVAGVPGVTLTAFGTPKPDGQTNFPVFVVTHPRALSVYVTNGADYQYEFSASVGFPSPPPPSPSPAPSLAPGEVPPGIYTVRVRRDPSYLLAYTDPRSASGNPQSYLANSEGIGFYGTYPKVPLPSEPPLHPLSMAIATTSGYFLDQATRQLVAFDSNARSVTPYPASVDGYADGDLTSAKFRGPVDLWYDMATQSFLVADRGNSCLRKIANGQVSTLAGAPGRPTADGPAATAGFAGLKAVCSDLDGNVYVAEDGGRIRRLGLDGQLTTVIDAGYGEISDLAIDRYNRLWIVDQGNKRVVAVPL